MISALAKLRLALGLALGFILFRLAYSVVFTAASSGDTLIDLPGIRLGGIFSHVVLFGSVGLQGLGNSLLSAIPFALAIIGFGLVSIFLTPARILGIARRSKSGLLLALSISLATLPALLDASRRIALAIRLRGEKKSRILIPLLETAIEKAVIVGIRFATSPRTSVAKNQSVTLTELRLPGATNTINLGLKPGDVAVISGPTGSGKTSLLETLAGITSLRTGRSHDGEVRVFGFDPAAELAEVSGLVGYVPQQPRTWFLAENVSAELLGPRLSWIDFEDHCIESLSEGQAVKLAISNALAHSPKLILLDEPFAALDSESRKELADLIRARADSGAIVVVAEHQLAGIEIDGAKHFVFDGELSTGRYQPELVHPVRRLPIVGRDLLIDYAVPMIRDLQLPERVVVHQSERIAILGPNGIGKTSLLAQIAQDIPGARFVPERVEDFFVCQSLADELDRSDRVASASSGLTQLTLESLIPIPDELLRTHPRDLSAGTKLAIAIAMQLAHKPNLLLVDEPVKGLDPKARNQVAEVLACVAETGCAVLFATHDEEFAEGADKKIELEAVPR